MMEDDGYFAGKLLVAMPTIGDPRFDRTVIVMCEHNDRGAMGIVVNKCLDEMAMSDLLEQVDIETGPEFVDTSVFYGGPVEAGRGFVVHSPEYRCDGTLMIGEQIRVTTTLDILRAIADGTGPRQHRMALGYAGWGPGQLEGEIQANGWLTVDLATELVFGEADTAWEQAIATLGISPAMLSATAGHA